MKRIEKGMEPAKLMDYRNANPRSTWEQMRNDAASSGKDTYTEIKRTAVNDQGGLCAYCEADITNQTQQIEHFHPKSDNGGTHNWALDWNNLLAVCDGGSNPYSPAYLEPLPDNLSCDQHKNYLSQKGGLSAACEGWLLNALQLAAFPNLFAIHLGTGKLRANVEICASVPVFEPNHCGDTAALVENTIRILNLNCDRLCQDRLRVIRSLEHAKKQLRQRGIPTNQALPSLTQHYFQRRWSPFFTVIRSYLGETAERHLESIGYQG
ncbi:retron system putative HNH endonuclease [Methylomagnum sp.]